MTQISAFPESRLFPRQKDGMPVDPSTTPGMTRSCLCVNGHHPAINPMVKRALLAMWAYEEGPRDHHTWNTDFGFEPEASDNYDDNVARQAFSQWLLDQGVPRNTVVIVELEEFQGTLA